MLVLAKAGVQAVLLSLLRTALTLTVWAVSLTWLGTSNRKPASAALKVQLGAPKLQVVALDAAGVLLLVPSSVAAVVVACRLTVVVLLPAAMLKLAPAGQTTLPPVALSVPVTPLVKALSEDWQKMKASQLPLGRFGEPEEVARAVVFLASDDGRYLTGQTINADGGQLML